MADFQKLNNLTGWAVFIIATVVFWLTAEPTASYWDCGEFISVSYKLEVPHPPGAPLFLLIGRIFSFFAMGDVEKVAYWINIVSVLSGGFTILFLFWTITLFGRKLLKTKNNTITAGQVYLLMGAGLIGSLALTFSDSFWFSAVEAEVYGMSLFFTAFVVWAILKWDFIEDESQANKWLVLIFYMMGLSIGVHLLNLVTLPALGLIIYFKKFKTTTKGIIYTLLISILLIGLINGFIIPGIPSIASSFEIFFVNNLGLPFKSGLIVFVLLFIGIIIYGLYYSQKKKKSILNTALLGFSFILIGYSSYAIILIRSGYNPPIDQNNPENIINFVSYLNRDQYGSRPLVHGQYFDAELIDQKRGAPVYKKGPDKYQIVNYKIKQVFDPQRTTIIPRAWSNSTDHIEQYRKWMDLKNNEIPNFGHNLKFMFNYQIGYMYMRYFLWNFAGRESDIQGASWLSPLDAFKEIPVELRENKGRNNYFMLPLILGLMGMFFSYRKSQQIFGVIFILFVLTGVALVIYLNSPPVEPRERDYIYAGSYYAYAIWIGLGIIAIGQYLYRYIRNLRISAFMATGIGLIVPIIMVTENWDDHDRSNRYFSVDSAKNFLSSCAPQAILFTGGDNDTYPLWYTQEVEGFRADMRVIVLSYFNTDWYIDQMTRKANESEPLSFSIDKNLYRQGGPNDFLPFIENPNIGENAISLEAYLNLVRQDHDAIKVQTTFGDYNSLPSKTLYLNIDKKYVKSLGIIPSDMNDLIPDQMIFNLKGDVLEKNTLMILDMIVNGDWERPIYFNNTSLLNAGIDFRRFVVQEGNTYRLLPIDSGNIHESLVNTEVMFNNMMNKFSFRQMNNPDVYYSEDYRRFAMSNRINFNTLAEALMKKGENTRATEVLQRSLEVMPDNSIPYDYSNIQTASLLFQLNEVDTAVNITETLGTKAIDYLNYYSKYNNSQQNEIQKHMTILSLLSRILKQYQQNELALNFETSFLDFYSKFSK